jgi:molybdenum cofactor cytidylyltransferase
MHISPRPGSIDDATNTTPDSASVAGPDTAAEATAAAVASAVPTTEPGQSADASSGPVTDRVAAIVLAAGASTRLGAGRSKQLLRYQGRTLLRHSVEQALSSSCRPVIVVLGAEVERCQRELEGLDVHVTINPAWAEGMGSSIRAGMTALTAAAPDARAVVITLCDQPLVAAAFIDRLVQRYLAQAAEAAEVGDSGDSGADGDREPTVAAEYDGRPGVPALFPRSRFGELSRLDGAAGARHLLRASAVSNTSAASTALAAQQRAGRGADAAAGPERASSRVVTLPCPEAAVDVDTITDYEALPQ